MIKLCAKRIVKNDKEYPNFDVKFGQKICLGGRFLIHGLCTAVSIVRALKSSSEVLIFQAEYIRVLDYR